MTSLLRRENLTLMLVVDILMSISLFLEPAGKSIFSVSKDTGHSSSSCFLLRVSNWKDSLN